MPNPHTQAFSLINISGWQGAFVTINAVILILLLAKAHSLDCGRFFSFFYLGYN